MRSGTHVPAHYDFFDINAHLRVVVDDVGITYTKLSTEQRKTRRHATSART